MVDPAEQQEAEAWCQVWDPISSAYYYYNSVTHVSQFELPEIFRRATSSNEAEDDSDEEAKDAAKNVGRASVIGLLASNFKSYPPELRAVLRIQSTYRRKQARRAVRAARAKNAVSQSTNKGSKDGAWLVFNDPATGADYFYNQETQEVSWTLPLGESLASVHEPTATSSHAGCDELASDSDDKKGNEDKENGNEKDRKGKLEDSTKTDTQPNEDGVKRVKENSNLLDTTQNAVSEPGTEDIGINNIGNEWMELLDPSSGNYYYYNVRTQESTWEKPKTFTKFDLRSIGDKLISPEVRAAVLVQNTWRGKVARREVRKQRGKTKRSGLSQNLDSPWQRLNDPQSGYDYYYNSETQEVCWEQPKEFQEVNKESGANKETTLETTQEESTEDDSPTFLNARSPDEREDRQADPLPSSIETMKDEEKDLTKEDQNISPRSAGKEDASDQATNTKDLNKVRESDQLGSLRSLSTGKTAKSSMTASANSEPRESRKWTWVELYDPATRRSYFYNQKTHVSSWAVPQDEPKEEIGTVAKGFDHRLSDELIAVMRIQIQFRARIARTRVRQYRAIRHQGNSDRLWVEVLDNLTGQPYFFNTKTLEVSWDPPSRNSSRKLSGVTLNDKSQATLEDANQSQKNELEPENETISEKAQELATLEEKERVYTNGKASKVESKEGSEINQQNELNESSLDEPASVDSKASQDHIPSLKNTYDAKALNVVGGSSHESDIVAVTDNEKGNFEQNGVESSVAKDALSATKENGFQSGRTEDTKLARLSPVSHLKDDPDGLNMQTSVLQNKDTIALHIKSEPSTLPQSGTSTPRSKSSPAPNKSHFETERTECSILTTASSGHISEAEDEDDQPEHFEGVSNEVKERMRLIEVSSVLNTKRFTRLMTLTELARKAGVELEGRKAKSLKQSVRVAELAAEEATQAIEELSKTKNGPEKLEAVSKALKAVVFCEAQQMLAAKATFGLHCLLLEKGTNSFRTIVEKLESANITTSRKVLRLQQSLDAELELARIRIKHVQVFSHRSSVSEASLEARWQAMQSKLISRVAYRSRYYVKQILKIEEADYEKAFARTMQAAQDNGGSFRSELGFVVDRIEGQSPWWPTYEMAMFATVDTWQKVQEFETFARKMSDHAREEKEQRAMMAEEANQRATQSAKNSLKYELACRKAFLDMCRNAWTLGIRQRRATEEAEHPARKSRIEDSMKMKHKKGAIAVAKKPIRKRLLVHIDGYSSPWRACMATNSSLDDFCKALEEEKLRRINQERRSFNIDQPDPDSGRLLLHVACWYSRLDIVKFLLSEGANPNATQNSLDLTRPVHVAARAGRSDIIEALVEQGASLYAQDSAGDTALHWACRVESLPCVRSLLNLARSQGAHSDTQEGLWLLVAKVNERSKTPTEVLPRNEEESLSYTGQRIHKLLRQLEIHSQKKLLQADEI